MVGGISVLTWLLASFLFYADVRYSDDVTGFLLQLSDNESGNPNLFDINWEIMRITDLIFYACITLFWFIYSFVFFIWRHRSQKKKQLQRNEEEKKPPLVINDTHDNVRAVVCPLRYLKFHFAEKLMICTATHAFDKRVAQTPIKFPLEAALPMYTYVRNSCDVVHHREWRNIIKLQTLWAVRLGTKQTFEGSSPLPMFLKETTFRSQFCRFSNRRSSRTLGRAAKTFHLR